VSFTLRTLTTMMYKLRNMTHVMLAHWVSRNSVLFFAIFRPKFTKLSTHVQEGLKFATPFPFDDASFWSEDICDQVVKLTEICAILWCSWATKFLAVVVPNFAPNFKHSGHHSVCELTGCILELLCTFLCCMHSKPDLANEQFLLPGLVSVSLFTICEM